MSKSKDKEASTEVTVQQPGSLVIPAGLDLNLLAQDQGAGTQGVRATDLATPIICILQSNSPQCKKSDGKFIKGAAEGMLLNNVTNELFDGEKGIEVIPCFFEKVFIEWKPNRGGFVAIHGVDTPLRDQVKMVANSEGKETPTLPSGNNLIETNQHYVLLVLNDGVLEPAVIAMSSSALKSSRLWNTLVKRVMLNDGKGSMFNPASYYMRYKLSTKARTKDQYSWFGWAVEPVGPVTTKVQYDAGKALEQAVSSGTVRVKQEQVDGDLPTAALKDDDELPFDAKPATAA